MSPRAAFLSFRFGPTDGVSVVARTWMAAFARFGFEVVAVAGEGLADRCVRGFALEEGPEPDEDGLRVALEDVDLVVVENLLTIPLNLPASRVAARVLAGRPALLHHHDPPWHRARFQHVRELPTDDPAWRHVAITRTLGRELAERGIRATVLHNAFAAPPRRSPAELRAMRERVREALGVADEEILVAHPVRAIERKDVPAALALCEELGATYWLLGPAEEGYGDTLEELLASAKCRVLHRSWPEAEEFYAAADHVTFPSTWEGFGNPPIEAALHRRPVSVGSYPVAAELRELGFDWLDPGDAASIRATLADPEGPATTRLLDVNERIAREHFGIERMEAILRELLDAAGWLP